MKQDIMLYVHIPFCLQKCQYCDFLSFSATKEERQQYVQALLREIAAWKEAGPMRTVSLFIGGGTPSLLENELLNRILEALHDTFEFAPGCEQTLEANPGTVTAEKAKNWKQKGINRISMGVQSMDDALLKRLGRIHDSRQVRESWQILREAGLDNLSFDLMMGLPEQKPGQWEDTLQQALQMQPRHLSCYSLILEEGTPFYEQAGTLELPDEDEERAMYHNTQQILEEAGWIQYEISNFSQPGFESRHNTGYWRRAPYIGMGLGAASLLPEQIRCTNTGNLQQYLQGSGNLQTIRVEEQVLTRTDQMEEFMFLGLRCTQGVQKEEFARYFGCSMESVYLSILEKHRKDGLLEEQDGWVRLTKRGMDLANCVMADFLLS